MERTQCVTARQSQSLSSAQDSPNAGARHGNLIALSVAVPSFFALVIAYILGRLEKREGKR
jgi:hypothetical protein